MSCAKTCAKKKSGRGKPSPAIRFDLAAAREMADHFAIACGVRCALYDADGQLLYEQGEPNAGCAFCRRLSELTGAHFRCEALHGWAAEQARRFGGRYIYSCPTGMAFFASPILMGGAYAGGMVGGPVLLMDTDDFLDNDLLALDRLTPEQAAGVKLLLLCVPQEEPRKLEHLSGQLFAGAVYIGDSSHELFLSRQENTQQNAIGDYIARLKTGENAPTYPMEKEMELTRAIAQGDKAEAGDLLNEILGYIFFYTRSTAEIRTRVMELLVILSRAAVRGGAKMEQIFQLNQQYMQEMQYLDSQEKLTRWLAGSLNRFTSLVFDLVDVKHRSALHDAVDYIKEHYASPLTLEETAARAGYSPAYFSRLFREEMGRTFKEYLNELRVERSKALLLSGDSSILEICTSVGYNDQSYYCKIFRRLTGVSPAVFRKRTRRIDADKEYGLK